MPTGLVFLALYEVPITMEEETQGMETTGKSLNITRITRLT